MSLTAHLQNPETMKAGLNLVCDYGFELMKNFIFFLFGKLEPFLILVKIIKVETDKIFYG